MTRKGKLCLLGVVVALLAIIILVRMVTSRDKLKQGPAAVARLSTPEESIALLPFQDLSLSDGNSGFADGVQQGINNRLAKFHDLKVISRSTMMQYNATPTRNLREVAQALGATKVLEGSVQRADNRVRVNVQLIDTKTETHIWANRYDRETTDISALEREIAKDVADQLGAKGSPGERNHR